VAPALAREVNFLGWSLCCSVVNVRAEWGVVNPHFLVQWEVKEYKFDQREMTGISLNGTLGGGLR
jgi:hypothetical protein